MEQLLVEAGHIAEKPPSQKISQATRPLPRLVPWSLEEYRSRYSKSLYKTCSWVSGAMLMTVRCYLGRK